jgi:hypothetical protein
MDIIHRNKSKGKPPPVGFDMMNLSLDLTFATWSFFCIPSRSFVVFDENQSFILSPPALHLIKALG